MEYTNIYNYPQEIVDTLSKDRYTDENDLPSDYSVTQAISPIQQTILLKQYPKDQIEKDILDLWPTFLGSVGHAVLEEAWKAENGSKIEERLYVTIDNGAGIKRVISGKFDNYKEPELRDYKFTKVYKIMKGDFTDWERQLNCYAYFCEENGYKVERLRVFAFLTDFKKYERYKKNYPERPILEISIPLWEKEKQKEYVEGRVKDLMLAEGMTKKILSENFPCSDRDMWRNVIDYAIIKKGAERAYRKFDTEDEANAFFSEKNLSGSEYGVVRRMSKRKRCLDWCPVANICEQNRNLLLEEGEDPDEYYKKPIF